MTDPLAGFAEMRERVQAQMDQARRRQEAVHRLAREIDDATSRASSPRGEVTVVATAKGAVSRVELGSAAMDLAPQALGDLITSTIRAAQKAAAEHALALTENALGNGAFTAELRADIQQRYGDDEAGPDSYLSRFTGR
ncbi:YbaB/EbfC family nucleoid-associated protein [Microbacterium sp. Marseille-Q6965]|uniref:YbaB/EbfC family nucleoid-associated protein n=1 Tax=Microbacterium sp. Marseille-Q6965 TaxID=2965072 RepID=UPI0021B80E71|nr:YbaB/EbfC family nucleoid-associated protein [Microbacterium sp. Marseille-Q6965]